MRTSATFKVDSDIGKSVSERTYFDSIGVLPVTSTSRNTRKRKKNSDERESNTDVEVKIFLSGRDDNIASFESDTALSEL
jgi:hypothetical protein